ncbi:MAG: energy transducer TonB [Sphingobacteriaceae bacterium]|jgi:TonB family protein|nr:MAG: energy transducer TonB [Pedobacter sp.]
MEDQFKRSNTDRSLLYIGIGLGMIILILGYLTFFVDEPSKVFSNQPSSLSSTTEANSTLLNSNSGESEQAIKNSLTKFIDTFYYDQNKGYFDPPSYFANPTQTYYNYHNLTFDRLQEIHNRRLADMHHLQQNWIVSSLEFKQNGSSITATYMLRQSYYKPSQGKQEVSDSKIEMIVQDGKIISLRELETKNISSINTTEPYNSMTTVVSSENKLYDLNTVSTPPEFPGGQQAWVQYLNTNLKYPIEAQENSIQGKVYVGFVVEKDGSLSDISIINGIDSGCNEEAIRVLQHSPRWIPGTFKGSPVRTTFTLTISFQLTNR